MKKRWYVVHVRSTFENKVSEYIYEQSELKGIRDKFDDIIVPVESVVDVKNGKRVTKENRLFPGYILVNMELTDETWHLVCNSSKVSGFLGSGKRPSPIPNSEAEAIIQQQEDSSLAPRSVLNYEVGEKIKVIDGPFRDFTGVVEEVDADKSRLKVCVRIFERDTPVDLEYLQVEKEQ